MAKTAKAQVPQNPYSTTREGNEMRSLHAANGGVPRVLQLKRACTATKGLTAKNKLIIFKKTKHHNIKKQIKDWRKHLPYKEKFEPRKIAQ